MKWEHEDPRARYRDRSLLGGARHRRPHHRALRRARTRSRRAAVAHGRRGAGRGWRHARDRSTPSRSAAGPVASPECGSPRASRRGWLSARAWVSCPSPISPRLRNARVRAAVRRHANPRRSTMRACARSTGRHFDVRDAGVLAGRRACESRVRKSRCRTALTLVRTGWRPDAGLRACPGARRALPAGGRPGDPGRCCRARREILLLARPGRGGRQILIRRRITGLCQGSRRGRPHCNQSAIDCRCNAHATKPSLGMPCQQTCPQNRFWSSKTSVRFAK